MLKTLSIARLTFSAESHRTEISTLLIIGFCLMLFMSYIFLNPTLSQQITSTVHTETPTTDDTLMLQGGLFYAEICLYLVAFLLGANLLFSDQKSGILDILLSRPLSRFQYLLGKFVGSVILCGVLYLAMILPAIVVVLFTDSVDTLVAILLTVFFVIIKMIILFSLILFFLQRSPRWVAPLLALMFIVTGYFSGYISLFHSSTEGIFRWLTLMSYYVIPHLTEVTVATLFDPVESGISYAIWLVGYGFVYPAVFLSVSVIMFKRKSF